MQDVAQQSSGWVVIKFGGTSVASRAHWNTIASIARTRLGEGLRPLLVCSAVAGVSNLLEELLRQAPDSAYQSCQARIEAVHRELARELGLDADELLADEFQTLGRAALGASLVREVSPRLHARVMALGELMSTTLGAAFFNAQGLATAWIDARTLLQSVPPPHARDVQRYLSATCEYAFDPGLQQRLTRESAQVLLTQGFIARDDHGHTVVLGRGGSDTSAAYLAAKLGARRCEIWTDVPGMYTANPHQVPSARLLRALDYDEALEIVSTGAKVLHPRCIAPVRDALIPLHVLSTHNPELEGTVVASRARTATAQVKAISVKRGVMLVSMNTPGMWQQVGFLADVTACFKRAGLSIDLVSTSEMNVTVSLDAEANRIDPDTMQLLLRDLEPYCAAHLIGPCAAIGLVGRNIRAILHKLAPALEVFEEHKIHLVSQAASDLNLTFVVDQDQADRLVADLHELLFGHRTADDTLGPSWQDLSAGPVQPAPKPPWWVRKRDRLLALAASESPLYVYDEETLLEALQQVRSIQAVDRVLYAIKANPHPEVIRRFEQAGLGFECVAPGEVERVLETVPSLDRERILFTPNFAARGEYQRAYELGVRVTLDNLYPLEAWPDVFRDREAFVRIDPGRGRGHHAHVKTGGATSKFGVAPEQLGRLRELVMRHRVHVVGLHAHLGSGIRTSGNWAETALFLAQQAEAFPEAQILDAGGGLGVPERWEEGALDIRALDESMQQVKKAHPRYRLWLEPGRYLVAQAGVLLATVTQTKQKGSIRYVGVNTGMNSLIRPALYGSFHQIANLTRLEEEPSIVANVVGPICESGDTLGHSRKLPVTQEGDVLVVATVGAYGRAMSSQYNLRLPAREVLLASESRT